MEARVVTKPTYIVAELPDKLATWVNDVRAAVEPDISHLPAEITLAGSSGIGPLAPGQRLNMVQDEVLKALEGKVSFTFELTGINRFDGTDIFFAEPERAGFERLHLALKASKLKFLPNAFPYIPHCSLKGFTSLQTGQRDMLESLSVPPSRHRIKAVSVYEMDDMQPLKLLSLSP